MSYAHSKKDTQALTDRAAELIKSGMAYRAVRDALVAEFGCARMTAHYAYHRARAGGGDNWGGKREGAGRPFNEPDSRID